MITDLRAAEAARARVLRLGGGARRPSATRGSWQGPARTFRSIPRAAARAASVLRTCDTFDLELPAWLSPPFSVVVQKRLAVHQRPEQVLRARGAAGARPPRISGLVRVRRMSAAGSWWRGTGPRPAPGRACRPDTAFAMRPRLSATASEMVRPLTRFSACGRLRSLRRSHSHDDSRGGLPNRSRKPSLPICGSATCSALVSGGASGKLGPHAGRLGERVHQFFGAQPPRHGVREVVAVLLVPLVGWRHRPGRCASWRWSA